MAQSVIEMNLTKEHNKFIFYAKQLILIRNKTNDSICMLENSGIKKIEDSVSLSDLDVNEDVLNQLDRLLLLPPSIIITGQESLTKIYLASKLLQEQQLQSLCQKELPSNQSLSSYQFCFYYPVKETFQVPVKESIDNSDDADEENVDRPNSEIKNYQEQNSTVTQEEKNQLISLGINNKLLDEGLEITITRSDLNTEECIEYVNKIYEEQFQKSHPVILFTISKDIFSQQNIMELEYLRENHPNVPILFVQMSYVEKPSECELPESEQQPWNFDAPSEETSNALKKSLFHNLPEDILHILCDQLGYLQLDLPPPTISEMFLDGELKLQSDYVQDSHSSFKIKQFFKKHFLSRLINASSILNKTHTKYMRMFILFAFDMARDIQITPKRIIYAKEKENELYNNLVDIASKKQDEIKDIISDSVKELKENISNIIVKHEFKDVDLSSSEVSSKDARLCSCEIQDLLMVALNDLVGRRLVSRLNVMRESYLGTLQRCLENLEKDCRACGESPDIGEALKQMMNAAYHVELNTSYSFIRSCLEKMKQLVTAMKPVATIDHDWKLKIANDVLFSLSESKLTKDICHQFKDRLKTSHDAFVCCMRKLENQLVCHLEEKEERQMKLKKMDAPKLARLFLESTSLTDRIVHGMPQLEREIGRGQYGVVFGCKSWGGNQSCAIKSLVPMDSKHWNDLAMEFYYTKSLPEHNRIVALKGSVIDYSYGQGVTPAVLLIMERLGRDLHSGLKMGLDWKCRLQISLDVTQGIRFLHSQGLVHRDIKLKNVLLNDDYRAKLTDLGFCKPEAMMSGSIVGTPIHMAPELFSGHYDNSVDVYAFGILFWYICSGQTKLPSMFESCYSKDQLWNCVRRGVRPERLSVFSDDCWKLMQSCWASLPGDRPFLGVVEPQLEEMMTRVDETETSVPVQETSNENYSRDFDISL